MPTSEQELSHNLAREWVTDRLGAAWTERAMVESEWIEKGVAWPQTSGEHQEPTGLAPPEIVRVSVTVPASTDAPTIERMIDELREETEADPRLGGRVERGSIRD